MSSDDAETGAKALRELAAWIVRDGVDGDFLEQYMQGLLSNQLIELHASCRVEAMVVSRCFANMTAHDVAGRLYECACELERSGSAIRTSARRELRKCTITSISQHVRNDSAPGKPCPTFACQRHSSWLPELIATVVFSVLGMILLSVERGDSTLRHLAGGGYIGLGVIYAAATVHSAWRDSQQGHRR